MRTWFEGGATTVKKVGVHMKAPQHIQRNELRAEGKPAMSYMTCIILHLFYSFTCILLIFVTLACSFDCCKLNAER